MIELPRTWHIVLRLQGHVTVKEESFSNHCRVDGPSLNRYSAIGLSLLQARLSGTHYRLSFVICLSVLVFFGALLRRYYLRDISASSTIEDA